jgi:predicted DNA-binding protein
MEIELPKMAKKVPFQIYLELDQYKRLKKDSEITNVPISVTIRQAIQDALNAMDRFIEIGEQNANE